MQRHNSVGSSRRRVSSLRSSKVGKAQRSLALFSLKNPPKWTDRAACVDEPSETFFPDPPRRGASRVEQREYLKKIDEAKDFCLTKCPVLEQCLLAAVGANERYGVFAGYDFSSAEDRDAAKARVARQSLEAC